MRTIYLTDTYGDTFTVDYVDQGGNDLSTAAFKIAFVPEATLTPPPLASALWRTPVSALHPGTAALSILLTSTSGLTPGHYHVWLQVTISGVTFPVQVLDDAGTGRPLLVYVV